MLDRMQAAYRRIAESLDLQRRFVADVSHELRTPLTTIRGNLALLRRKPPISRADREDVLADAEGESERLIRLVNGLLTLARADVARHAETTRVEIKPVVEDVCRQGRLLAPDRAFDCDFLPELPVMADRDTLKQVLLALIDNAVKYAEGAIAVRAEARDGCVAIAVQDAGPGMDADTLSRIFDRFYRGEQARSTNGFGLGLPIAKALTEAQGGELDVRSEPGAGSVFTVTLPQAAN
jgi:signal transduction histidine kinase